MIRSPSARWGVQAWALLCLLLPWVQAWAPLPEAHVVPWLLSWAALAGLWWVRESLQWPWVVKTWVVAALFNAAVGLLQYFGLAQALEGWVHVPSVLGEAMGQLRQRNQLASLLAIGTLGLLWWRSQGLSRAWTLGALVLLMLGQAATGSRTGLLHSLMIPVLVLWWWRRSGAHRGLLAWALLALVLQGAASLLLPSWLFWWGGPDVAGALQRMTGSDGCASRRVLWSNMLQLLIERPWSGWGWDGLKYAHYMADYPGERFCDILGHAHNLPLHLAVTLGLPVALLASLALVFWLYRQAPWRETQSARLLAWSVLAVIGLHSLLEFPLWYGPFQMAVLLCLGLLLQGQPLLAPPSVRLQRMLAAAVLTGAVLVGLDYARVRQVFLPASERAAWAKGDAAWRLARQTLFFGDTVAFAELSVTPVTPDNARAQLQASLHLLHYSPEPRVIRHLIDSAERLGETELAEWHWRQWQRVYRGQDRTTPAKPQDLTGH